MPCISPTDDAEGYDLFIFSKTYSSRRIAKALRENINFMWIAGGNKPDFRTINRFRLDMKDVIEDVFYEVVKLLIEKNNIKMQNYFLDGTKIKANANKYTFVWNKTIQNYDRKLDEMMTWKKQVKAVVLQRSRLLQLWKVLNESWKKHQKIKP